MKIHQNSTSHYAIKAVITDLDRTLLHTDKSVSEYTIEALRKCRERGILVMAASARPLRDLRLFGEMIAFDAVAATNGAVVALPDRILEFGIPTDIGEEILSRITMFHDVFLSVETSLGYYANRDIPIWAPIIYDKFPHLPEKAILYKILASSENRALYDGVSGTLTDGVYSTVSNGDLVQIMSCDATKWKGIKHMLAHYGVSAEDAVYFGDDNDDIEPIKNCGLGVAVANAIPAVLDAADAVAQNNDLDGVAKFICDNILL